MAGFAIVMAALIYGLLGLTFAAIGSICLYLYAKKARSRKSALICASTPFVALLWLFITFLIHVQISNRFAHQDCGFGPDPYVTLPNGYILGSHNTYDGYIAAPGSKTGVAIVGPGYVRSIVDLQLSNGNFIGTQFDFKTSRVRPFVFNTATKEFQTSDDNDSTGKNCDSTDPECVELWARAETSAHEDPNSYWRLYDRYRRRWPTYVLMILIVSGITSIVLSAARFWVRSADKGPPLIADGLTGN